MKWITVLPFAALMAIGAIPIAAQADVNLTFGVYASDKPSAMVRQFRPILNILESKMSKQLGEPVKITMHVAKTYEQGIDDLVSGRVDFARFGPASYIEAKESEPGVSILVVESNKGKKVFHGVICVAKGSPIKGVEDLRGARFAFGDERSTIGRYLSQLYLLRHDIRAADLGYFEYLGRHDKVGAAVGAGRFEAGALKESTFNKLVEKGVPLVSIGSFPNVTKPWIARSGLSEKVSRTLRAVLLNIKDKNALKNLSKDGFLLGSDEDYAFIRESILTNHLFFRGANKPNDSS